MPTMSVPLQILYCRHVYKAGITDIQVLNVQILFTYLNHSFTLQILLLTFRILLLTFQIIFLVL